MRTYETISLKATRAGVAVVTLNRPEKHNAFNAETIQELTDAFDVVADEDNLRMVILRGAGKSFSAGADLDWMKAAADYSREDNERDGFALAEMLRKLNELPQMTLALVQGAAYGGGAGLVACCDVAIAMKSAKFRFSEVRLGLTPSTIAPYVIAAIGPSWRGHCSLRARVLAATMPRRWGSCSTRSRAMKRWPRWRNISQSWCSVQRPAL